jgi:hypothetical protein
MASAAVIDSPGRLGSRSASRPRTAFVLSGGASLGALQVGMLRALYESGIAPDALVGTSAGALNAGRRPHRHVAVSGILMRAQRRRMVISTPADPGLGPGSLRMRNPPGGLTLLSGRTRHFQWRSAGEYVTRESAVSPLGVEFNRGKQ